MFFKLLCVNSFASLVMGIDGLTFLSTINFIKLKLRWALGSPLLYKASNPIRLSRYLEHLILSWMEQQGATQYIFTLELLFACFDGDEHNNPHKSFFGAPTRSSSCASWSLQTPSQWVVATTKSNKKTLLLNNLLVPLNEITQCNVLESWSHTQMMKSQSSMCIYEACEGSKSPNMLGQRQVYRALHTELAAMLLFLLGNFCEHG